MVQKDMDNNLELTGVQCRGIKKIGEHCTSSCSDNVWKGVKCMSEQHRQERHAREGKKKLKRLQGWMGSLTDLTLA